MSGSVTAPGLDGPAVASLEYVNARVIEVKLPSGMSLRPQGRYTPYTELILLKLADGTTVEVNHLVKGVSLYDTRPDVGDEMVIEVKREGENGLPEETNIKDFSRLFPLSLLVAVMGVSVIAIGGKKGLMALVALVVTLLLVTHGLLPLLLAGYPPLITTWVISFVASGATMVLVAGATRKALAALTGVGAGLLASSLFSVSFVGFCHLTGLKTTNVQGLLSSPLYRLEDVRGLLILGIIISSLGAVMDMAMGVASFAFELKKAKPGISWKDLFKHSASMGSSVVGTMFGTLFMAFLGHSVPWIIAFKVGELPFPLFLNWELTAVEIGKITAAAAGLAVSVPATAWAACYLQKQTGNTGKPSAGLVISRPGNLSGARLIPLFLVGVLVIYPVASLAQAPDYEFFLYNFLRIKERGETIVTGTVLEVKPHPSGKIQELKYKLEDGAIIAGRNILWGSEKYDTVLKTGNRVVLRLNRDRAGKAEFLTFDKRREYLTALGVTVLLLTWIGGRKGLATVLGGACTLLYFGKILLPALEVGYYPLSAAILTAFLTAVSVLFLLCGVNRKSAAAIAGSIAGLSITALTTWAFYGGLHLKGSTGEPMQIMFYVTSMSGRLEWNPSTIILAGMVLGAAGAVIDVAMTVAAAVFEMARAHSGLHPGQLVRHGLAVGKDVISTMVNTLVLAYAGSGVSTLLLLKIYRPSALLFHREEISLFVLESVSGILGFVLAVPLTALAAAYLAGRVQKGKSDHGPVSTNCAP